MPSCHSETASPFPTPHPTVITLTVLLRKMKAPPATMPVPVEAALHPKHLTSRQRKLVAGREGAEWH